MGSMLTITPLRNAALSTQGAAQAGFTFRRAWGGEARPPNGSRARRCRHIRRTKRDLPFTPYP